MENNSILLSLCIPTNGIVEWVVPVIESIYAQGVDNTLFEVVVTDNGLKSDLESSVRLFDYPNFHYYRTNTQGFVNQIDAFEKCTGQFCKMLNHRSKMVPGSINALLEFVRKYQDTKPILYCAEGHVKGGEFIECSNIDEFVKRMKVWVSWSAGVGAWREDISNVRHKMIDNYFPHMVFLFELREESEYVIWNGKYEIMANEAGKGGYDVFHVFAVVLPNLISRLLAEQRISISTFISFKKALYNYIRSIYYAEIVCPTNRTFIIQNIRDNMMVYYGKTEYIMMIITCYLRRPLAIIKYAIMNFVR